MATPGYTKMLRRLWLGALTAMIYRFAPLTEATIPNSGKEEEEKFIVLTKDEEGHGTVPVPVTFRRDDTLSAAQYKHCVILGPACFQWKYDGKYRDNSEIQLFKRKHKPQISDDLRLPLENNEVLAVLEAAIVHIRAKFTDREDIVNDMQTQPEWLKDSSGRDYKRFYTTNHEFWAINANNVGALFRISRGSALVSGAAILYIVQNFQQRTMDNKRYDRFFQDPTGYSIVGHWRFLDYELFLGKPEVLPWSPTRRQQTYGLFPNGKNHHIYPGLPHEGKGTKTYNTVGTRKQHKSRDFPNPRTEGQQRDINFGLEKSAGRGNKALANTENRIHSRETEELTSNIKVLLIQASNNRGRIIDDSKTKVNWSTMARLPTLQIGSTDVSRIETPSTCSTFPQCLEQTHAAALQTEQKGVNLRGVGSSSTFAGNEGRVESYSTVNPFNESVPSRCQAIPTTDQKLQMYSKLLTEIAELCEAESARRRGGT